MKNLTGILILTTTLLSIQTKATNYYFSSTDGDDSRTSAQAQSSSTPWKTIDKLNSFFSSLQPGDVVLFKRGDVFYGSISVKKSGSSGSPISFDAYGSGAKPIITGFTDVTSWSNIGSNLWMSSNSVSSLATLNIVAIRGSFAPIGKWPTNGYNSLTQSGVGTSITHTSLTSSWSGGTVVIRKNHWIIDKSTITSQSGTTINISNPTPYTASSGWGWFIQNHQSACDVQNEWWYDASSKKIGIYSTATPSRVQVSTIENLLSIDGNSFLSFNDLIFQGSNSAAVTISSGNNIKFEGCDFLFQGMNGFTVQSAAHHITLNNCTANYTNNDFIFGGGSANWTLTNNIITNTAQVPGMGNSADGNYIALYNIGANSLIQYNVIRKTGYSGIDFRGSGISVLNNLVDTFCNVKDDGAGIYTFTGASTTTYAMRTVDQNIVLNGGGADAGANTNNSDAFGIYMDDNSSNVTITNNTVANCGGAGLFLHAAHDIVAQNNTIYNCATTGSYGQLLNIYPGAVTTAPVKNITLTGNKIISRTASQLVAYLNFTGVDMNQLGTWDNNYYCRPSNENGSTFEVLSSATQTTNLEGWQSSFKKDKSSKKSPKTISDLNDLKFEYNATASDKIVNLGASYIDVTGKKYKGLITLAPYSSAVLIHESGKVANQPPVVNAGPDKNLSLPTTTMTLTGSSIDPDGTITAYQWTKIAGPSQFSIASPTLAKTSLSNLAEGIYQFELKVTDNSGATAKDTISVTVNAVSNQPPVVNAGKKQTISLPVNSTTLNGDASDKDGNIATYKWSEISGPSSARIETPNLVTTNIKALTKGVYTFELRVTDNQGAIGKDTVAITVNEKATSNNSNQPPVADAGNKQAILLPLNSAILNGGSSSDKDGSVVAYRWLEISGPSSAIIETPSLVSTNVTALAKGFYTFELKVTDNDGAIGRDTVTITVNEKASSSSNQPPVANAGNNQTILLPLNSAILNGSQSSDKDGTIAAYSWSEISGPSAADIETPKLVSTNVTTLVKGTHKFELKVTDNEGAIGRDTVTIIVDSEPTNHSPNQLPVANAGLDINMTLPTNSVTITGKGSDADGSVTSYRWDKISGQNCFIQNPNQAKTAINNLTEGIYIFELEVRDDQNASRRDTMRVTVNAAAKPTPPLSAPGNADSSTADRGNAVTIYPNPVTDNFNVEINNNNKGKMIIQIISPAGAVINSFIFDKDQENKKVNLLSRGLTSGVYFLRVQIGNWTDTKKIIKL